MFEAAPALTEIGAAVALSANATRELARLGLLDALAAVSTEPSELIFRDGRTGDRTAAHDVAANERYRERFGAPYFGIHRADLKAVLSGAVGGEGLHLGHRLTAPEEDGAGLRLRFANGRSEQADLVIGADGVPFAVSCPSPRCRACLTRVRSSSGWGQMRTCSITRSAVRRRM